MEVTMSGKSLLSLFMFILLLSQYMKTRFVLSLTGEVDVNNIKCIERERRALLKIKQDLIDEYGHLSSWGNEEHKKDCCNWRGVLCSNRTGHVVSLNLNLYVYVYGSHNYKPLKGKISASLLELQHLNYLNLTLNDFGGQQIPEFIGSLNKLRHLDLSYANFSGRVPYQLGNLSRLKSLDLSSDSGALYAGKLDWLSHLSSLRKIGLNSVNLSEATDWLQVISGLPSLTTLQLGWCNLPSVNPSSISFINSTKSLASIALLSNNLSDSIYPWLFHYRSSLAYLDLSVNNLQGSIPTAFCNMTSLISLSLYVNQIDGVPKCFRDLCGLRELDLQENKISGPLTALFSNLSGCIRDNLELLSLSDNSLTGPWPDFTGFSSLKYLGVSRNRLNVTMTKSIGQLSKLELFSVESSSLKGTISEAHLSNLSRLIYMDLSLNSLTLNFNKDWTPPFRLLYIYLAGCKLGPSFPKWLQTQNTVSILDISNAGISDIIPNWFWGLPMLSKLNLSHNQLSGVLPDLSKLSMCYDIDLSSNCFEGSIKSVPPHLISLILSNNMLSGAISFLCGITGNTLIYLDLSDNQFLAEMPNCFMHWHQLEVLSLANNNFSGRIPNNIMSNCQIWALDLHNNSLFGDLPFSLKNCKELTIIDLGNNKLSGTIPAWMGGDLSNLAVLSLRSNQFRGNMPIQLCELTNIQILDFSQNNISGTIPECLNNLTAIVQQGSSSAAIELDIVTFVDGSRRSQGMLYQGHIFLIWKGIYSQYESTLGLVKSIDFSSNKLSGNIPKEITSLVGLISLNLSRNSLIGSIPTEIGKLKWLNTLDLSENRFTGEIPESFSQLDSLGVLNLSNNNFSGKIPASTKPQSFSAYSYVGNHNLCGTPLPNKCLGDEPAKAPKIIVSNIGDGLITRGVYISMVLGFIIGFWGVCGTLVLNKSSRYAYFQFLNDTNDKLHILAAVNIAKLQRKLRS